MITGAEAAKKEAAKGAEKLKESLETVKEAAKEAEKEMKKLLKIAEDRAENRKDIFEREKQRRLALETKSDNQRIELEKRIADLRKVRSFLAVGFVA